MHNDVGIEILNVKHQPPNDFTAGVRVSFAYVDLTTEVMIQEHNIKFLRFEEIDAIPCRFHIGDSMFSAEDRLEDFNPLRIVFQNENSVSGSQHVCKGLVRVLYCGLFALRSVCRLECLFERRCRSLSGLHGPNGRQ